MKTEISDSIDQISKERTKTERTWTIPGKVNNDSPLASEFGAPQFGASGIGATVKGMSPDERLLDDTTVDRLVHLLDSYNKQVRGWLDQDSEERIGKWPSVMTFALFGLGLGIVGVTNYWSYGRQFADHEFVLFNLSGAMVFLLAGISLFYDRSVREIGHDHLCKEAGRRVETMSEHVRSLSQLYQKWIVDWKAQKQQLDRLEEGVRLFDAQATASQIKAAQFKVESEELGRQRDLLNDEVEVLKSTVTQLKADADFANLKLIGIDSEIEAKKEHLSDLRVEREKARKEILEIQEKGDEARDSFELARSEYEANRRHFERELQSFERRIEKLAAESDRLQSLRDSLEREQIELDSDLKSLKAEYERNVEIQKHSLAKLNQSLEDARIEQALIDEAISTSQTNLRQMVSEQQELKTSIETMSVSKEHLQSSIQVLNEEISQKRELNELLESQTKVLVDDRELRCTKLDRAISELDGKLTGRREELAQATEVFETVQGNHRQLTAEIDHLNRVKAAMETSVDELTNRLANKSSDFKRKTIQVQELASKLDAASGVPKGDAGVRATEVRTQLRGPHWEQEQLKRMLDRIDEIDHLAEEGLD